MKHLLIPDAPHGSRRLVFYLAAEEWIASRGEDACFTWHTLPTVICGRNQNPEAEFDAAFCRVRGIEAYRRKSGGGCVYSDSGNLMISSILVHREGKNVGTVFSDFLERVAGALRSLGLEAVTTSRNDILLNGRKVSGNAFFRSPKADIVHGTLLYDSDLGVMQRVLTPSVQKLARHGVCSVRQRVANLKEFTDRTSVEVEAAVLRALCEGGGTISLTEKDLVEISEIENTYKRIL